MNKKVIIDMDDKSHFCDKFEFEGKLVCFFDEEGNRISIPLYNVKRIMVFGVKKKRD